MSIADKEFVRRLVKESPVSGWDDAWCVNVMPCHE